MVGLTECICICVYERGQGEPLSAVIRMRSHGILRCEHILWPRDVVKTT